MEKSFTILTILLVVFILSSTNTFAQVSIEIQRYEAAAKKGEVYAQDSLGHYYYVGQGVSQSYTKAVNWWFTAAKQGDAYAQFWLGRCLYDGKGIEQSYVEASQWWHKAAEQGNVDAQYMLGHCYFEGQGVCQSNEEGYKWAQKAFKGLLKSAKQGDIEAQYMLGVGCYAIGYGVEKSDAKAYKWMRKAIEQGYDGDLLVLNTIEEAIKEFEKYRSASKKGDAQAQYNLGLCYYYGNGTDKSYKEAIKWLKKAAILGEKNAKEMLEIIHSQQKEQ